MSIEVIRMAEQARGAFDGGKIRENKPIGFPQEGGKGKPVSSLFYWARAWSDGGGLIDQHPHEGFEIMSYVLAGEIEHYDNQLKGWKKLKKGDVQLIRAGNGIVHAEKILAGGAIFQIWFDPDLEKTLRQPASYDDYPESSFPVKKDKGLVTKTIKGPKAPMTMVTEGLEMEDQSLEPGSYALPRSPTACSLAYLLEGRLAVNGVALEVHDAVLVKGEDRLEVEVKSPSRWFVVHAPLAPSYRTYASRRGW